ncbi:alpha/beta hydrolase [Methanonatronarchaeum sp. AMET-Sl]|uniref:alpha/beta fold hydrolase n=1 Tax=Methanonatronarchaeum sp. AMET-Sl TaxID=3037654 RepID=UPI00244DA9A5|nr:alpha/beta hydrolase [Methanonatronarchaeum sp. AMET-Sl]WGI18103.1 alpha/beta hydrolase [Methanonatronarchaeum sp. AMET-Sl]
MFYESSFGEIYYRVYGSKNKRTLVFTHGLGLDHQTFREQVKEFSKKNVVVVWDLPGCGKSCKLDRTLSFEEASKIIIGLLDEIEVSEAVLVGQSLGSMISQHTTKKYPDRVSGLIHIGGAPIHGFNKIETNLIKLHPYLLKITPHRLFSSIFSNFTSNKPKTKQYSKQKALENGKKTIINQEKGLIQAIKQTKPTKNNKPQLIITGQNESKTLTKKTDKWLKTLPNGENKNIPNAGHLTNQDNPEKTNQAIKTYLQKNH